MKNFSLSFSAEFSTLLSKNNRGMDFRGGNYFIKILPTQRCHISMNFKSKRWTKFVARKPRQSIPYVILLTCKIIGSHDLLPLSHHCYHHNHLTSHPLCPPHVAINNRFKLLPKASKQATCHPHMHNTCAFARIRLGKLLLPLATLGTKLDRLLAKLSPDSLPASIHALRNTSNTTHSRSIQRYHKDKEGGAHCTHNAHTTRQHIRLGGCLVFS